MHPKTLWLILAAFLLLPNLNAVSLETQTIDGSNYYWTSVNDSNGNPFVLINRSSGNAQWSTTETDNITDALSRLNWLKYSFGFGRLAANNTVLGVLVPGMDTFNTYGYNTSTEWHTESNKSTSLGGGQPVVMRLKHERNDGDYYVNMTIRYEMGNVAYNSLTDILFFLKIQNITHFDKVNVYQDNKIYDVSIFGSVNFSNVSKVGLHGNQSPPSWEYVFDDSESNVVYIKDGNVWLGYPIGRNLPAYSSFQRSFQAIDAECSIECSLPDFITIEYEEEDAGTEVANNYSIDVRWFDSLNLCFISAGCRMNIAMRDVYGTAAACEMVSENTAKWMACTLTDPDNGCNTYSGVKYATTSIKPVENTYYNFRLTNMGRYSSLASDSAYKLKGQISVGGVGLANTCGARDIGLEISGSDTTAPLISCTLNGNAIANNSINTIVPTNGSLIYANASFNCTFSNPATPYEENTGLVNNTYVSANITGWNNEKNISVQSTIDNYYALQNGTFPINNSMAYLLCAGANGTARVAASGVDTNWSQTAPWCYIVTKFTIIATPVPTTTGTSLYSISLFQNEEEDDEEIIKPFLWLTFFIAIATALWALKQSNSPPNNSTALQ